MSNKAINEKKSQQLGMPIGTATAKLRLKVIFDLLREYKINTCFKCHKEISSSEDLSLTHLKHWLDIDPSLFWSTNNITFTHRECSRAAQLKENMIEIQLVDENNKPFNTYTHEGKVYFEGVKGKNYGIKVKNTSIERIEVVITVDGRDIVSGKNGDYTTQRGYILNPFSETVLKGWRQTDNDVARFSFSNKEDSYSGLEGTPENIGVIGVAVFKEQVKPLNVIKIREPYYVPVPYIPWEPAPWVPWKPRWITDWTLTDNIGSYEYSRGTGGGTFSSSGGKISCSVQGQSSDFLRGDIGNIGTEYGETTLSSIEKTSFDRKDKMAPDNVIIFYYDDHEGLKARGVIKQVPVAPNPFPNVPKVTAGYARPPKRKNVVYK